jgi:hypothetical protein
VAIEYTTTSQITAAHGVKCAIFGGAGLGKTASFATAPAPFLIAVEPGLIVLKRENIVRMFGQATPGISYDIPAAIIKHLPGQSALPQVREVLAAFKRADPWTTSIQTIGLDSISQLAEWELAFQLTQTPNGQKAYGEMADEILELIREFTSLPSKNVICTAKQSVSSHSGLYSASFPGQLLDFHFPHEFDVILQLCTAEGEAGTPTRYFRTQPDFKNFAKDRTGALDPRGEPAFFYHIFNKISAA